MKRNFDDPEYKKWRTSVYKRDKFKCQWPGCSISKKLNAHHIKTWAEFPGLRYCTSNGITLCYLHHKMIKGLENIYESTFFKILADKGNQK
jgi:predicted restriction endonuclease